MIKIKFCGINDPAALAAASGAGADWIGFVFYPPSPRFVTPAQAAALAAAVPDAIPARVGLFVDPSDDAVAQALATIPLDALQIHAGPDRAAALRRRFGLPVWRAVGIATEADLPGPEPDIDAHLLDAKAPDDSILPGGNAISFDWSVLRAWTAPLPWLLAGGLTPSNVAQAIAASNAPAVDVSSGVESSRGVKDPALIHAFAAAARSGG